MSNVNMQSQIIKNEAGFAFVEAKRAELERKIFLKNQKEREMKKQKSQENGSNKQTLNFKKRNSNFKQEKFEDEREMKIHNIERSFKEDEIQNTIKSQNQPEIRKSNLTSKPLKTSLIKSNESNLDLGEESMNLQKDEKEKVSYSHINQLKNQNFSPFENSNSKEVSPLKTNQKIENPSFSITQPKLSFLQYNESQISPKEIPEMFENKNENDKYELRSLLSETKKCMEELKTFYKETDDRKKETNSVSTILNKKDSGQTLEYSDSYKKISFENVSSFKGKFEDEFVGNSSLNLIPKAEMPYSNPNFSLPQSKYNWNNLDKIPNFSQDNFLKNSTNLYVIRENRFINESIEEKNYWDNQDYYFSPQKQYLMSSNEKEDHFEENSQEINVKKSYENLRYEEEYSDGNSKSKNRSDIDSDDSRFFQRENYFGGYPNGDQMELEKPMKSPEKSFEVYEEENFKQNVLPKFSGIMTFGESQFEIHSSSQIGKNDSEKEDSVKLEASEIQNISSYGLNSHVKEEQRIETLPSEKKKQNKWGKGFVKQMKPDIQTEPNDFEPQNNSGTNNRRKWDSVKIPENNFVKEPEPNILDNNEIFEKEPEKNFFHEKLDKTTDFSRENFNYQIEIDSPQTKEKRKQLLQDFLKRKNSERSERSQREPIPILLQSKKTSKEANIKLEEVSIKKDIFERKKKIVNEMTFQPIQDLKRSKERTPEIKSRNSFQNQRSKTPVKAPLSPFKKECNPPPKRALTGPSNKKTIIAALKHVCFAGEHLKKEREFAVSKIEESNAQNFLIVFKSQLGRNVQSLIKEIKAIYEYDHQFDSTHKILGQKYFPDEIAQNEISQFFQFNTGNRKFSEIVMKKSLSLGIDAISMKLSFFKKPNNH